MTDTKLPPVYFVVAIFALLWNAMGLFFFLSSVTMSPESIAELKPELQPIITESPTWNWIAYGTATIAGFLGSIGLILQKRWAYPLFFISLLGIFVQNLWSFVISDLMTDMDASKYIMPSLVIAIGIFLLYYTKSVLAKNWLK